VVKCSRCREADINSKAGFLVFCAAAAAIGRGSREKNGAKEEGAKKKLSAR